MIQTGQILQQRYRIDRQIGQGGMGAVYIATDERFGSTVAIKETLCMDDNYRKAIEREARLLNSLKHHALPRVTDHFLESEGQFLVMEYIPGEDLCCILDNQEEPFSSDQVLDWADQLLEALDFLHNLENPVVHRDIKPQNLKVTPKGRVILLDFGLAKGNVTGAGNQTNAKSIFGYSRNYASLEQIQGTGTDPRSDLYSLAATLYHLLTKLPPEDALTRAMSVLSQKPDPLVPANQVRPEIPAGVAAILHKALDLDAAERPGSAAEMRRMLRSHADFAELAYSTVSVARGSSVDIHSQPTQLMPGITTRDPLAKTNVVDEGLSQVTAIRPLAQRVNTAPEPAEAPRRKLALAAVAGGLVLLGSTIAGVLAYQGSFADEAEPIPVSVVETLEETVPKGDANPKSPELVEAASTADSVSEAAKTDAAATTKKQEPAKTARSSSNRRNDAGDDPDDDVIINNADITVGNVRVKDGKVYMPDGRVYDVSKEHRKPSVRPPMAPQKWPTEDQFRQLSPEQRRKFRMLRQRYPNAIPPEPRRDPKN